MSNMQVRRALVVGWFSFVHGEATAGDLLSMETVQAQLQRAGVPHDVAWSPVMRPPGGVLLDEADPSGYSHVVFVCGPVHGTPVRQLHERFAACHRTAIGVSVIDPEDPAVRGFDVVLPRDAPDRTPLVDLGAHPHPASVPVVGVFLAQGQKEYGAQRRHETVTETITDWLGTVDAARLSLDTRLDPRDWRLSATVAQSESVVRRLDVVVTTRLHGLVLALKNGVPAVAVDPVAGGGKVSAQAEAWGWPALVGAEEAHATTLTAHLAWCLSPEGRAAALERRDRAALAPALVDELLQVLDSTPRDEAALTR